MMASPAWGRRQRQCACGTHSLADGGCAACRRKRTGWLRSSAVNSAQANEVRPKVHEMLRAPGQPSDANAWATMEPRFGHDFSRVRARAEALPVVPADGSEARNSIGDADDDPIHSPLIEQFRREERLPPGGRDETGVPVGPSIAEIKYGGLLMPCPGSTEVATAIDLRNEALAAGFRTAYGIHTQMRVRPDGRTWDGTKISESLTMGANSCPESLTRGEPCSGGSIFTVGDESGKSPVLAGPRPGARNQFWDFHTTHVRPRGLSVLHDATRNPAKLNTCSTACEQEYRCGGSIIGRHTVTRTYRKGTHKNQDVTFVDVTKT